MFKNMSFSKKIMLILGFTSIIIILGIGVTAYMMLKNDLENRVEEELRQINDSTYNLIESTIDTALRNYLKAIADKTLDFVKDKYDLYKKGMISEEEAYERTREFILSPNVLRIGKTGYISVSSVKGILVIHPRSEGIDASDQEFMQRAMKQKNGYVEFEWQDVDEEKPRKKAGYMVYFAPWDLIIWSTAYKDEFYDIMELKELREKIISIKLRKTGYMYVLDKNAKLVFDPYIEGLITREFTDTNGKYFVKEMMRKKNGRIVYFWRNDKKEEWREKVVLYKHYEKLDWLICSGVYLDELYEPIYKLRTVILVISFIALVFVFFLSFFMGRSISRPVKKLADGAEKIGEGNLDVRIDIDSADEIGDLAKTFNKMAASLKKSNLQIEAQAEELREANIALCPCGKCA
ncbi:MAG: cache domain-containing protein [Candidatus Aminicenantes bacterium]|nr:cache domain-containing protein [Candidatus Aminicenantes bacterium]